MQGKRTDRVGHLIQMELGQLILKKIRDPRLGFVTITHVDVNPDMKSALVFYTVLGEEKQRTETRTALDRAVGFLQKEIGASLKLRYTPKLQFRFDETLERGFEIDRLIHKIHKEKSE